MSASDRLEQIEAFARFLLDSHGLTDWTFSCNRRCRDLGLCLEGPKIIQLSIHFIRLNSDEVVRNTLLHEIAHALVGTAHGHDAVWQACCVEIGARPERVSRDAIMPEGRWQARCGCCGFVHHRYRRPKHAVGWWCRYCGQERGKLTWGRTA